MTHIFIGCDSKDVKRRQSAEHTDQRLMAYATLRCEISRCCLSVRRDPICNSEVGNNPKSFAIPENL